MFSFNPWKNLTCVGECRFGTAGFCRTGSFNTSQFVTNTMRVCTKDAANVEYDAAVPVKPKWKDTSKKYSDVEFCAPLETDVPWSLDDSNIGDTGMPLLIFALCLWLTKLRNCSQACFLLEMHPCGGEPCGRTMDCTQTEIKFERWKTPALACGPSTSGLVPALEARQTYRTWCRAQQMWIAIPSLLQQNLNVCVESAFCTELRQQRATRTKIAAAGIGCVLGMAHV